MILYQITRPFSYLSIEHPEKWKFDWLIPLILTFLSLSICFLLRPYLNFFGESGLINQILSFVQILPGFYIAALAAISTFNRIDIDQYMPDPTPQIDIIISGEKNKIKLTRRRFLCMLFAFLATESILLALCSIAALTTAVAFKTMLPPPMHPFVSYSFLFLYLIIFWQLLTATLLGLYYLGDRLHQPD
jgi:hypothetical protein